MRIMAQSPCGSPKCHRLRAAKCPWVLDLMSSQYLQSGLEDDLVSKVLAFKCRDLSNPELCKDAECLSVHISMSIDWHTELT